MRTITYSDTDYFYKRFQKLVYKSDKLAIITDFKSLEEMPERGRRLFRMGQKKFGSSTRKTGPALDKRYKINLGQDTFNRIRILVSI